MSESTNWAAVHNRLGCYGCHFASDSVGSGPCCSRWDGPAPDSNGRCTRRRTDAEANSTFAALSLARGGR